ncbi:MAG TPA: S9 family peptidase [Vicinamibacterales bacterium]|nr:S9 family peptidase [Vicinamibacterales bacterium]
MRRTLQRALLAVAACGIAAPAAAQTPLVAADLYRLRSVGEVALSPDATRVAYTVTQNPAQGRPYAQLWIMELASGRTARVGDEQSRGSSPVWSPDGSRLAFQGRIGNAEGGVVVVRADGSGAGVVAPKQGTNSAAITQEGDGIAWSPDGRRLAIVHATPGPETADADGDPKVITRYLYKPTASEGNTRFNDNRRLHIFIADLETRQVRQLTDGVYSEHSIDWSPAGDEIVFVSNREPDPDFVFNNDLFAVKVSDGSIRRITATEGAEYRPHWSPDGKAIAYQASRRGITDLETTMEDTHVWTVSADGSNRRDRGAAIDNRQGEPQWNRDGSALYTTVQERGHVRLYRLDPGGAGGAVVIDEPGVVGSFSVGRDDQIAYAHSSPSDLAQLRWKAPPRASSATRALTDLNSEVLRGRALAPMEPFTFVSNDLAHEVEAWLVKPIGLTATSSHPLIVSIHGGPHGVQGPAFNLQNQVYAGLGWAVLMVNYRGSVGYGQAWADAVFRDQNGDEAQDVLYGVNAAIRRYPWIDRTRLGVEGGSYGGQLSAWLVAITNIFKAAIPRWPIINLVSYNYMTYYPMYEEMEFGAKVHTADWLDQLWRRSSLRYVNGVKTPTLLMHGENDNDVPIAESEQFYMGLKDAGVETVMVRYPREGHGVREPVHTVDMITRSIAWYRAHF